MDKNTIIIDRNRVSKTPRTAIRAAEQLKRQATEQAKRQAAGKSSL